MPFRPKSDLFFQIQLLYQNFKVIERSCFPQDFDLTKLEVNGVIPSTEFHLPEINCWLCHWGRTRTTNLIEPALYISLVSIHELPNVIIKITTTIIQKLDITNLILD